MRLSTSPIPSVRTNSGKRRCVPHVRYTAKPARATESVGKVMLSCWVTAAEQYNICSCAIKQLGIMIASC